MNLYYLTIAIIALAVAQALTILLTIGREREIEQLRELITEQRILIAQMRAWMSGRMQNAQARRIKSDREPMREPNVPAVPPKDSPDIAQPPTNEDETKEDAAKRLTKVKPTREPIAEDNKAQRPDIKPKELPETIQPRATEAETEEDAAMRLTKATNWLKEDADRAREIVAALQGKPQDKAG